MPRMTVDNRYTILGYYKYSTLRIR